MYKAVKNIVSKALSPQTLQKLEPLIRPLLALAYRGNKVHCPLCKSSFSHFIPLSDQDDSDLLCVSCGSIQRKRLLWLYLTRELQIGSKTWSILDFTPHRAIVRNMLRFKRLDYLTTDYETDSCDKQYDITDIPEADGELDLIICYHIFEHVPEADKGMRELFRILKSGGVALLQVPHHPGETQEDLSITDPQERLRLYGQEDHVRYYGRKDFVAKLTAAGFQVEELQYAQTFSAEEQARFVLNPKEIIFVCRKA